MTKEHIHYLSNDHKTLIHAVCWVPDGEPRAVLQISHGMVEFMERYEEFASYMCQRGFVVTGNDHLGHGESVRSREDYGYFGDKNGNTVLLKDIQRLRKMVEERYPDLPYFLLGHSMGSFLVRQYICGYGRGLAGVIIMGTGYHTAFEAKLGMKLAENMAKIKGWHHRSRLIDLMAFGSYALSQKERRTNRDWLTKDEKIVDEYIADERCAFMFTLSGYYGLFLGLYKLTMNDYLKNMPRNLNILFTSGQEDPVGAKGRGVRHVYESFRKRGMRHVELKLYPGDRHEILNELDREQVYADLAVWMEKQMFDAHR